MSLHRPLWALAALAIAAPALAQPAPPSSGAEDDLRCAAWAAVVGGAYEDDPEVSVAFGMAMTWFTARYEGATGKPFEEALTAAYIRELEPQLEEVEAFCLPRMQEMGERFGTWGAKLQESGQ